MRAKTCIVLLFIVIGWFGNVKSQNTSGTLNGVWIPLKQEMNGNALPVSAFEKYKLTINDSVYTYGTTTTDVGVLNYADGKMDIYGREGVNKGKHFTAIYKLENAELTICYNLAGTGYPDTFETTGKPMIFLSVYKKE